MDDTVETWTYEIDADIDPLQRQLAQASVSGRQFGRQLTSAFAGVAIEGRGLGDVLKSLALGLSRLTLQAAFKPLEQGLGGLLTGLVSGGVVASANGNVFQRGLPVPFASGGVISSPVSFPLQGGRIGIAGEKGAEAIMPLTRGSDGRLGVQSIGGGAGPSITFNIQTPDAESFRRSQSQIAAMLARTVAQGQRNL